MPFEPSDSRKKVAIGLIGEELTKSRIRNSISSTSYPNRSSFFGHGNSHSPWKWRNEGTGDRMAT